RAAPLAVCRFVSMLCMRGLAPPRSTLFPYTTLFRSIMDIFRLPKFAWYFYRSQTEEGPVCFIAHYNLPSSGNTVRVYSNADTVKDWKSTRLNSSHVKISYAVFCLKKKKAHKRVQTSR